MSDKDKRILDSIAQALPNMGELEKANIVGFAEGINLMANAQNKAKVNGKEVMIER